VIDLSTLIALLTALASAAAPTGPLEPPGDPPAQHCSALPGATPGPTRSGGPVRQSSAPETGTEPVPLSVQDDWPETGPADAGTEDGAPQRLRAGPENNDDTSDDNTSDDNTSDDQDTGRPTTTPTERPESERRADNSDDNRQSLPTADPAPTPNSTRASPRTGSEQTDDAEATETPSTRATPRGPGSDTGRSTDSPTAGDHRRPTGSRCTDPPPDAAPDPSGEDSARDIEVPSDLVDLADWYLTLPTGPDGDPDTIQPGQLAGYSSDYFRLNQSRDGVVFTAPVDGATTRNSDYPRSELREMNGTEEASWSNGNGTHTLRATEAVTELPESKPELVTAQIHGGDDDIMQIRLEGKRLMVQYADGGQQIMLDPDYRLGTPYDIEIEAAANSVRVAYNGQPKAEIPLSGSTWYFKAGAYVQSNPAKGDAVGAAGQVVIYALEVVHR
jgi:hypothetical protein